MELFSARGEGGLEAAHTFEAGVLGTVFVSAGIANSITTLTAFLRRVFLYVVCVQVQ